MNTMKWNLRRFVQATANLFYALCVKRMASMLSCGYKIFNKLCFLVFFKKIAFKNLSVYDQSFFVTVKCFIENHQKTNLIGEKQNYPKFGKIRWPFSHLNDIIQ